MQKVSVIVSTSLEVPNDPFEKKCKKAKWLSEEALQIAEKREAKGKGEKERHTRLNAEFQRITRRDKKPSPVDRKSVV